MKTFWTLVFSFSRYIQQIRVWSSIKVTNYLLCVQLRIRDRPHTLLWIMVNGFDGLYGFCGKEIWWCFAYKFHTKNCTFYYSWTWMEITVLNTENWDILFYIAIIKFYLFLGQETITNSNLTTLIHFSFKKIVQTFTFTSIVNRCP